MVVPIALGLLKQQPFVLDMAELLFIVRLHPRGSDYPTIVSSMSWEATCEHCGHELSGPDFSLLGVQLGRHYLNCAKSKGSKT